MEGIKYVNMIEISSVVTEIWRVENGELAVPVNNTLVCYMAFLAADTQPCISIHCMLTVYKSLILVILATCTAVFLGHATFIQSRYIPMSLFHLIQLQWSL